MYLQSWQFVMVIFPYNEFRSFGYCHGCFRNKMGPNFQMELKEKEKTSYNHYLLPRNFLFHSLYSKRYQVWLLVEKRGNQRLRDNFTVTGATFWTITQFFPFWAVTRCRHQLQGPAGHSFSLCVLQKRNSGKEWITLDFRRSGVWSCSPREVGITTERPAIGPKNELASNV